jgi:galactokinase
VRNQPLVIALALAEDILGKQGAFRIQGGGFAGTIEAFVPDELKNCFIEKIESLFGVGHCHVLSLRPEGVTID